MNFQYTVPRVIKQINKKSEVPMTVRRMTKAEMIKYNIKVTK